VATNQGRKPAHVIGGSRQEQEASRSSAWQQPAMTPREADNPHAPPQRGTDAARCLDHHARCRIEMLSRRGAQENRSGAGLPRANCVRVNTCGSNGCAAPQATSANGRIRSARC